MASLMNAVRRMGMNPAQEAAQLGQKATDLCEEVTKGCNPEAVKKARVAFIRSAQVGVPHLETTVEGMPAYRADNNLTGKINELNQAIKSIYNRIRTPQGVASKEYREELNLFIDTLSRYKTELSTLRDGLEARLYNERINDTERELQALAKKKLTKEIIWDEEGQNVGERGAYKSASSEDQDRSREGLEALEQLEQSHRQDKAAPYLYTLNNIRRDAGLETLCPCHWDDHAEAAAEIKAAQAKAKAAAEAEGKED